MKQSKDDPKPAARASLAAEAYLPPVLCAFLKDLERSTHSLEVWQLITALGRRLNLPHVDFISASDWRDWTKTLFIRTSYDASWLHGVNSDPDLSRWSYFRSHALYHLTPIAVGIEFAEDYLPLPEARKDVLREAARRGMRAGFSVPLRVHAPPQAGILTFCGDHGRAAMEAIIAEHGWTLHAGAQAAHQRYLHHFAQEFTERNDITPKQHELLELLGAGLMDKQIAARLGVSISATRQRLNALMDKTGLKSRAELAALAMSAGILPDPLNRPGHEGAPLVEMDVTAQE